MNPLAKLDQLNLEPAAKTEVAVVMQALLEQVQRDAKIIHANELKIAALTHELAYYKRIRFSTKSEALAPLQRDVFEETWNADLPTCRRSRSKSNSCKRIALVKPWLAQNVHVPDVNPYLTIYRASNIVTNPSPAPAANAGDIWSRSAKMLASNWMSNPLSFSCIAIFVHSMPAELAKPSLPHRFRQR